MKTYRFAGYWLTTDRELTAEEKLEVLGEFDVPQAEALAIENGEMPDEVLEEIDPYVEEEVIEEPA